MSSRTARASLPVVFVSLAMALFAGAALATTIGVSGNLDTFSTALGTLHATLQPAADGGDKSAKAQIKAIVTIDALLAKPATSASYFGEMKAAAKSAKSVANKLDNEATLDAALTDAAAAYRADLATARDSLAALVGTLTGKAQKAAQKKLAKADAKLAAADAALTLGDDFAALAAAAKLLLPTPGAGSLDGAGVPSAIAIDSTGVFVYVAELGDYPLDTIAGGIRQMTLAPDGSLTDLATAQTSGFTHVAAIVAHPTLGFVYAGGYGTTGIAQFAVGGDGQLVPLSPATVPMTEDAPIAALGIDASGTWLWALGNVFNGSPITCFKIENDGTLTEKDHDFAAPLAITLTPAPDGLHVWTSTGYDNSFTLHPEIRDFRNDGLGNVDWIGGYGAPNYYLGLVTSPDGSVVYAAHHIPAGGGEVKAFGVGLDGALAEFGAPPVTGNTPDAIAITPDGNWLYVGNRTDNTISQYAVAGDDTLTALGPATVAAPAPNALRITADGKFLLATNIAGIGPATSLVTVLAIGADGKLATP